MRLRSLPALALVGLLWLPAACTPPEPPTPDAGADEVDAGETPATPVPAPELTHLTPTGPANENAPVVTGTAPAGSVVRLFLSADCSGTAAALTEADAQGHFHTTVPVPDDATLTLSASAQVGAQLSPCSTSPLSYVEDSTPPAAPELLSTTPPSPDPSTQPLVRGRAEPHAHLDVFTTADCSGAPQASAQADAEGLFEAQVEVAPRAVTSLTAQATDAAGNVSACTSTPLTYEADLTPPEPPVLQSTTPASPANDNAPRLDGVAEPGARVTVTAGCTPEAPLLAEGVAGEDGGFSLVVPVPDDTRLSLVAHATDGSGNTSACSAPLLYVEDSSAPAAPVLADTAPTSPSNDTTPQLRVQGEPATRLSVFLSADCSGPEALGGKYLTGTSMLVEVSVPADTQVQLSARLTDLAGNVSACSAPLSYTTDTQPPAAPVLTTLEPASPSRSTTPRVGVTAEAGATVLLYGQVGCAGTPMATQVLDESGAGNVPVTVAANGTWHFTARARDRAGNTSPCTAGDLTYLTDNVPPFFTGGSVLDGVEGEASVQADATRMAARWSGFTDPRGISGYEWSLSHSTACLGEAVAATPVQLATSVSQEGLSLTDRTYYNCVRATDGVGNVSAWLASNGVTVDTQPPTVATLTPAEGALGVDILVHPTVVFSEAMDASTLTAQTVRLLREGVPVAAQLGCTSATCTLTPDAPLAYSTSYQLEVGAGVKDRVGHALASPATASFLVRPRQWFSASQLPGQTDGARLVKLAAGGDGSAVAVWRQTLAGGYVLLSSTYQRATGWPSPSTVALLPSATPEELVVAVDGTGAAMALWVAFPYSSGIAQVWAARRPAGGSWQPAQQLASISGSFFRPQLALDAQGNGWAAWERYDPLTAPYYQVAGARFTVAGGWQAAVDLDAVPDEASHPALALTAAGDGALVYRARNAQGYFVPTLRRFSAGSGQWSAPLAAAPSTHEMAGPAHLVLDDAGAVSILYPWAWRPEWTSTTYQHPVFLRQPQGGSFSFPVDLMDGQFYAAPQMTLAGTGSGRMVAAWMKGDTLVWGAAWTPAAGTWSTPVQLGQTYALESARMVPPAVAVAPSGEAVVAWAHVTEAAPFNQRVSAARLQPSGHWAPLEMLEPHPANFSSAVYASGKGAPLCAVATDGSFHLAWARHPGADLLPTRVWTARFD